MLAPAQDELNVYQSAEARFEIAAQKLGLEDGLYKYLKHPSKEIKVYIPIARDAGQLEIFIGFRVLHSSERMVWARARRAGAGHRNKRPDDGVGDGHVCDARAAGDHGGGDGQAA